MADLKLAGILSDIANSPIEYPAYPLTVNNEGTVVSFMGQSTLTVVATAAMQGILSNTALTQRGLTPGQVAIDAVQLAKALISEIEKSK